MKKILFMSLCLLSLYANANEDATDKYMAVYTTCTTFFSYVHESLCLRDRNVPPDKALENLMQLEARNMDHMVRSLGQPTRGSFEKEQLKNIVNEAYFGKFKHLDCESSSTLFGVGHAFVDYCRDKARDAITKRPPNWKPLE